MGFKVCPGSSSFAQPTPEMVACPDCGAEVEIWSDEATGACSGCKKTVIRQATQSCIDWCRYAQQCLGDEKYRQYGAMRAAMKKPALQHAVDAYFGEDHRPAERARKMVAYAEMVLPGQKRADPNVVLAAAALYRVAHAEAPPAADDAIQAILSELDYPAAFIANVASIILPDDAGAPVTEINARIVADAVLLADSEVRRKRMGPVELTEEFLDRFLTDDGRRIAGDLRAFMSGS